MIECQTADDVRRLAARQAEWRRNMFAPKPPVVETQPEPEPIPEPPPPDPPYVPLYTPIARIQSVVCARYNITLHEMMADRRTAKLVRPRHVAMWLAKKMTLRSMPEIGRRFNHRDHTTVLHAIRRIDALRSTDPEMAALLDELEAEVLA